MRPKALSQIKDILLFFLAIGLSGIVNGQGCSDAGFCTINNFKPSIVDSSFASKKNVIKLGISNGKADYSISIFSSYLEYSRQLSAKTSIDFKLSAISQDDNHIHVSGLSDFYVNANYLIGQKIKFTIGSKIPLTDGNRGQDGLPLPMDFQSSLGTFDLISGVSYEHKKIKFVLAFQHPLTQNNNQFFAEEYPQNSSLMQFQSTNEYVRSGDVLFRASYYLNLNRDIIFSPSILPIYHLKDDKFTDINGIERTIEGSQGLTFNVNIYLSYFLNAFHVIDLSFGAPVIKREARPDGLTRSHVLTLEYKINF